MCGEGWCWGHRAKKKHGLLIGTKTMKRSRLATSSTNQTVDFDSQLETQNGALIEAGLDYTIQNFNRTSVKVYARGGAEVWGGEPWHHLAWQRRRHLPVLICAALF